MVWHFRSFEMSEAMSKFSQPIDLMKLPGWMTGIHVWWITSKVSEWSHETNVLPSSTYATTGSIKLM